MQPGLEPRPLHQPRGLSIVQRWLPRTFSENEKFTYWNMSIISKIVLQRQRSWKFDEEKPNRIAMAANPMGGALKE